MFRSQISALAEKYEDEWEDCDASDPNGIMGTIVDEMLEPHRAHWLHRIVMTALWANVTGEKEIRNNLIVIANAISDNILLKNIPFMLELASNTMEESTSNRSDFL